MDGTKDMLPLTEAFYYILIALYQGPSHGYSIMQDVEKMSGGRVRIGAGTLYTALNTLLKKGFIANSPEIDNTDSRRKVYMITPQGKQAAAAEMERLEELLNNGRRLTAEGKGENGA